jgi:hypothetical protein
MTKTLAVPTVAKMLKGIVTPDGFTREVYTEPKTQWHPATKCLKLVGPGVEILIVFDGVSDSYSLASGHVSFDSPAGRRSFDRYGVEDSFYIENPARWGGEIPLHEHDRVYHNGGFGTVESSAGWKGWGEARTFVDEFVIKWDDSRSGTVKYTKRRLKSHGIVRADEIEQTNAKIKRFIEVKIPEAIERISRSEQVPGLPFMVTPERKEEIVKTLSGHRRFTWTPSGFGTGYVIQMNYGERGWKRVPAETEKFFGLKPLFFSTFDAD